MNTTELLIPGILCLLIAAVLISLTARLKRWSRRQKQRQSLLAAGKRGEEETAEILENLPGCRFILRNVYVPKVSGGTTEIDLIMLHKKGIFVVENKNYSGVILGSDRQERWTQLRFRGRERTERTFFSPVLQNDLHIRHLRRLLEDAGWGRVPVYSLITFNSRAVLKKARVNSPGVIVTEAGKAGRRITWKTWWRLPALSPRQARRLLGCLEQLENPGRKVRRQHVKSIRHAG